MTKKLFALLLAVATSIGTLFAWDYERVQIGDLYYNLNATNQTAEVTSQNSSYPYWSTTITTAIIPASVEYNSVTYSVTSIGAYTFQNCRGLTSVTIPNSVTSIGDMAFDGCRGLTSVTIPNSVTSIGGGAFWNCSSLTSLIYNTHVFAYMPTSYSGAYTIPDGIESIAGGAFDDCSGLTSVTIPNSVTSIGIEAFYGCTGLTSVTISNSVTSIGYQAFYGCASLTSVTIPNSVTSIGDHAFDDCKGLTSVTIPNSVTSIGRYAFHDCSGLTSVTIGNSVTSIGKWAFSGCSGLTSVTCFATTPPQLDKYVFDYVDKSTCVLYVPAGSISAYQSADVWKDFTNILPISQQGIEDVQGNNLQCTKMLIDGQLFILREGRIFNANGIQVR